MYSLALAGLTMAGLILRSIFPRVLNFAWTTPDFLLLLVVFNAMFRGYYHGAAVGFLIGLAEDLFFGRFIGLNALAKCVAGIVSGSLSKSIFKENMLVPVINVLLGSIISRIIVFVAGQLAGARWYFFPIIFQTLFEILMNVCLVPFVYGPFFHFADRYLQFEKEQDTGG